MKKAITRIDKYIIAKFLGTYVFSILLIISIAVVFDFNEKLDKFISKGAPTEAIIFDYYLNFIPYFANLFSALFVFISVIFFTSKLADNSEIIAMLSTGMSFKRLMRPYMISAGVIALMTLILSCFIIPPANRSRIEFQNKYVRDKRVTHASQIQMQIDNGLIFYLARFNSYDNNGRDLSLDKFDDKTLKTRLTAQRALYNDSNSWTLYNYTILDLTGIQQKITTGSKLDTIINVSPQDILASPTDYELMTSPQLYRYIKRQKERGMANIGGVNLTQFEVEYHKRYASVFSAFILTIIGAALSARKVKGGMGLNIGIGLGLSVTYILFMTISSSFAVAGAMSPILGVWLPNIVYVFIAAYVYRKAPN